MEEPIEEVTSSGQAEAARCDWCEHTSAAEEIRHQQRLERGNAAYVKAQELLARAEAQAATVQDILAVADAYRTASYL